MNKTPQDFLDAAKEAVAKKYGYTSFDLIDFYEVDLKHDNIHQPYAEERLRDEAALLALTNQAEELKKEIDKYYEIAVSLNRSED